MSEGISLSRRSESAPPKTPTSLEEARRVVAGFVDRYYHKRLHSAIRYIAQADKLHGRDAIILQERTRKLSEAQLRRAQITQQEEVKQVSVL